MALPTEDVLSNGIVTWSKITDRDNGVLALVVASVLSYVGSLPVASDEVATGDVLLGSIMLGARLYRRRNSPNGVEGMTEAGTTYVARHDPDVSRLLRLDSYVRPMAV